ncbi:SprT-like domain-containing protein [Delftia sp. PS-11]|uniref:SprT-like domain-containing protein n=1 Tax=Delftia sp. PS-11 TaxID=2767222 RepID=UPI002456B5ED|nr:SprT-like domain-containing protein [Delftia sp. PS-11]KAJ8742529.1 SprT-like domain-containing protein [Delftia sp. PS-11]
MPAATDSSFAPRYTVPTRETYAELQQAYEHFNQRLFADTLPHCLITLQREKRTCGYFSAARFASLDGRTTDEIALNPTYFAAVPIIETLQTLVHEMTHLWQHHFGKPGRARYHNEEWADKLESLGLMPSSTGRPGGRRTGDMMADYAMAGGPFLAACDALLTASFQLSWYDRFPAMEHVVTGQWSMATQILGMPGTQPPMSAVPALAQAVRPVGAPVAGPIPAAAETAAQSANRSLRIKYRCGGCAAPVQVWGKPGLHIVCGECSTRLMAQ